MVAKIALWLVALLGVLLLYLFLWPVPIDPVDWQAAPSPPLEGDYAANTLLQGMELIATPNSHGPEDVVLDADGRIYVGVEEGRILRYEPDGTNPEVFVDVGGRPYGLEFDAEGNLIVAHGQRGLLSIDPEGRTTVLCSEADGRPFRFTDDLAIDSQGIVWFTDASDQWGPHESLTEALESRPNGRLLKYDLATGECSLVLDELHFANGVALSPDETYVLVNETMRYRTKRVFVRGPMKGVVETFVDNLPGFPDNISTGSDGIFWLAIYAPRNQLLDSASPTPWLRRLIYRIPESLQPKALPHPIVLGVDENGKVMRNLQDSEGRGFSKSTSANQYGDMLYIGSLTEPAFG